MLNWTGLLDKKTVLLERGQTLAEMMMVMVVVGVMTALGVSYALGNTPHYRLNTAARSIVSDLRLIREKAVAEGQDKIIQINPSQNSYQLPGVGTVLLLPKVVFGTLSTIKTSPSGSSKPAVDGVSFTSDKATFQPDGTVSGLGGSIYLTDSQRVETLAITVNVTGRVRLYRWNGSAWD